MSNQISQADDRTMAQAFPDVPLDAKPLGNRVLLQLRQIRIKSPGGLIIPEDTRRQEVYHEMVALVRDVGPLAYRNADDLELWPEGAWCSPGDFVRVAKYGGDRWSVQIEIDGFTEIVYFVVVQDREIVSKINSFEAAKAIKTTI